MGLGIKLPEVLPSRNFPSRNIRFLLLPTSSGHNCFRFGEEPCPNFEVIVAGARLKKSARHSNAARRQPEQKFRLPAQEGLCFGEEQSIGGGCSPAAEVREDLVCLLVFRHALRPVPERHSEKSSRFADRHRKGRISDCAARPLFDFRGRRRRFDPS